MKMRLMIVSALCVVGALTLVGTSWSQDAAQPPAAPNPVIIPVQDPANRFVYSLYGGADNSARSKVARLMNQLREADDDSKKAELTKELETAVSEYFDEDMKAREGELTKLEERLTKLRAQLDRRRKAKGEIIQLQI